MITNRTKTGAKLSRGDYRFRVVRKQLKMPDGTRLASTMYVPYRKQKSEQFPVLLEILPYRKDDTFFLFDYPSYSYFARHGFIVVKVDIRGTGGSAGTLPDREYSDIELDDAEEIIRQVARLPQANGSVAMWGVSWSGFNSIQVAMRRPPELKTILAMHASDDLYHDDLHYIDGVLHVDNYHLFINHETGLPRTPDYRIDEAYFRNRFDQKPWMFTYLARQTDGAFWREKSLCSDYGAIDIPVYLIGGLHDGYRDTVVRMLENLSVPVKAEIGPWDHATPDDGTPGPNYEWQDEAIRWFEHWLKGYDNGVAEEMSRPKELLTFVRRGDAPDANLEKADGHWRKEPWPIERTDWTRFYPSAKGKLIRCSGRQSVDELVYRPGIGVNAGTWWGDTTGDVRNDDSYCLVYNSRPVQQPLEIVGMPKVKLKVSASARRAIWSVRLVDVSPAGEVSLVTGALINGRHIAGRDRPRSLKPGETYELELNLHFTTWTFKPGHRIRLCVSNAQFPMAWPSPTPMTTKLFTGSEESFLELPVVPQAGSPSSEPQLPEVQEKPDSPIGEDLDPGDDKPAYDKYFTYNPMTGKTTYVYRTNSAYQIKNRQFVIEGKNVWITDDKKPSVSEYTGVMTTDIQSPRRTIKVRTRVNLVSTSTCFKLTVTRDLFKDGKRIRKKTWKQSFARRNH